MVRIKFCMKWLSSCDFSRIRRISLDVLKIVWAYTNVPLKRLLVRFDWLIGLARNNRKSLVRPCLGLARGQSVAQRRIRCNWSSLLYSLSVKIVWKIVVSFKSRVMIEIIKEETHFLSVVWVEEIYFDLFSIVLNFRLLPFGRFFRRFSFVFLTHKVDRSCLWSKLRSWFKEPFRLLIICNLRK